MDDHLVASESRYEAVAGRLVYVPPALEPHALSHRGLATLLGAHRRPDLSVALDMLTRTGHEDDIAPDASIYPTARDPRTGGRQLEELAFELLAAERLAHAADKAARLTARGVRRVFAIDVLRMRVLEWSCELGTWGILAPDACIDDSALAVPLPVAALVDAAKADDAAVRAYRAQRHPEFLAERAEGHAEGHAEGWCEGTAFAVIAVLESRALPLEVEQRRRLLDERDPARLGRWLARAVTCTRVADLFEAE